MSADALKDYGISVVKVSKISCQVSLEFKHMDLWFSNLVHEVGNEAKQLE